MFLRPARERGIRYRTDAPIVEIEMEVTLLDALTSVHSWMKMNGQDGKPNLRRLDQVILHTRGTTLSAVGAAAPTENYLRDFPPDAAAWAQMFLASPSWADGGWRRVVGSAGVDTGVDDAAIAIAEAQAAAELDSRCRLADAIAALPAAEGVTLGDLAKRDPAVAQTLLAAQQRLKPRTDSRPGEDGRIESVLQTDLRPLWEMIVSRHGQVLTVAADEAHDAAEAEAEAVAAAEEAEVPAEAEAAEEAAETAEADEISVAADVAETADLETIVPDEPEPIEEENAISVADDAATEVETAVEDVAVEAIVVEAIVEEAVEEVEEIVDSLPTPEDAAADAASIDVEEVVEEVESPGDLSEAADPSADVDQPVEEFGDDVLIIEASDE